MKLYDFDGMFDEKLSAYVKKNAGKYTESEWEDLIPELYKSFGDTYIGSVGDTPNGFFEKLSDEELVTALKTYLKRGVPVSGFLCSAIEKRNSARLLMPLLDGSEEEKECAVNLIGSDDGAIKKYLELLISPTSDEGLKNKCLDFIKEKADLVVDDAVKYYLNGTECDYMLEIMARSVIPSDKVFEILLNRFRTDAENVSANAALLAQYGDERALKYLIDKIEEEGISYIEYKELLLAIESLGGVYDSQRDFSSDPYYELINSHASDNADIFGGLGKK